MDVKDIKIDDEFKSILFPLSPEDYKALEESLTEYGFSKSCPLIVWKGENILVDGHNRYEICQKHNISYCVSEEEFPDRDAVIDYILRMQLGRRNMNDFQRIEIVLRYKDIITKRAKGHQGTRNDIRKTSGSFDPEVDARKTTDTNEELGKIAGTSRASVIRTKRILRDGTDEQIEKVRSGEKAITTMDKEIRKEKKAKEEAPEGFMKCRKCGEIVPVSEMSRKGRDGICNKCYSAYDRRRRARIRGNSGAFEQIEKVSEFVKSDTYSSLGKDKDIIDEIIGATNRFVSLIESLVGELNLKKSRDDLLLELDALVEKIGVIKRNVEKED